MAERIREGALFAFYIDFTEALHSLYGIYIFLNL